MAERAANACRIGYPRAAFDIAELAWQAALEGPMPVDADARRPTLTELLDRFSISWQRDEGKAG